MRKKLPKFCQIFSSLFSSIFVQVFADLFVMTFALAFTPIAMFFLFAKTLGKALITKIKLNNPSHKVRSIQFKWELAI